MKLESLNPLERIIYIAEQQSQGVPLDSFCILATTTVQPFTTVAPGDIQARLIHLLGPILTLEAFAEAIGNKLRATGQVYLLGDQAVWGIAGQNDPPDHSWKMHLETLACAGLIFRFPVALKFGYKDPLLTQVRSNSWGKAAFEHFDLHHHAGFHTLVTRLEAVLEAHSEHYIELVRACQNPRRPLDIDRIQALNRRVPVPIVT